MSKFFLGWQTFGHTISQIFLKLCEVKGTWSHCWSMAYKIQHLSVTMVTVLSCFCWITAFKHPKLGDFGTKKLAKRKQNGTSRQWSFLIHWLSVLLRKTTCASGERLASLVFRLRRTLAPSALDTCASRSWLVSHEPC